MNIKRNITLFYILNFLTSFRFFGAFLVIYFAEITGSYTLAMSVLSVFTISAALLEIPTGLLSDKIGRKFTLFLGALCATLGVTCYAYAETLTLLYIGAAFYGTSYCLFSGNNSAFLYETLKALNKEKDFHHHLGRTQSMFQLGLALGALLSSFIVSNGLQTVFLIGIIPQALTIIVSLFFIEPVTKKRSHHNNKVHLYIAYRKIRRKPRLLSLIIAQAISQGAVDASFQFKTVFVNTVWPIAAIGIFRAINHGLSFFGFWFAGRIIDRFKALSIFVVREIYWAISQTIAVILSNVFSPILLISGTIFYGPGNVARDKLLQKEFSDKQRATMGSLASLTGSIMFAILSLIIGLIADNFSIGYAIMFGIIMSLCSLPFYLKSLHKA